MGVRRALRCFHFTSKRCRAPHCSTSCPCASPHTSLVNVGSLQPPALGSSQTLTRARSVTPGSGLSQALAEESGSCIWSHSGVGLWPCLWPKAAAFPRDQLMEQGVQRSLHELQGGGRKDLPKTAVCSLNAFFNYYYYHCSSHACLFRACLLFIREGFALSLTLCTMD